MQRLLLIQSLFPRRYGFFSQSHPAALACQHNRLATLSETAFLSLPGSRQRTKSRTPVSPSLPPTNPNRISTASVLTTLDPAAIALETKRIDKWSEMLRVGARDQGGNAKEWDVESGWWDGRGKGGGGKYRKLQRRVFKGVPDRWRRAVWGLELERMAKESAEGNVKSLVQLEREYKVRLRAIVRVERLETDHCLRVRRSISRFHQHRTSKSISTYRVPSRVTFCSTLVTDKVSVPCSTSCTRSDFIAMTLEAIVKAWDLSLLLYCATLNPR